MVPPPSVRIDVGAERGLAAVRFDLGEGTDAVEAVRLEVVHALGTTTVVVPPDATQVELDLGTLPAGPAELRVTPLRSKGREERSGSYSFAVPGRAGTGPAIARLRVRDRRLRRPRKTSTVMPRLLVAVDEAAAAAGAIHLELRRPDGSVEFAHVGPPPGGEGEIRPFELDAEAPAGKYAVHATAVDIDGNAGPTARTSFAVGADGAAAPAITSARWRKGDRIVVRGSGFAALGLVVLMDGTPLPVAEVEDRQLVVVGTNVVAGRLEVHTDLGGAVAPTPVGPPPSIEIGPAGATVAEGAPAQLYAIVRGGADPTVEWSVRKAQSVEISEDGLLTVGHDAPDVVAVRARNPASGAAATAKVTVVAPHGTDLTLGPRGGTVRGPGGATLTVPPGALEAPATIEMRTRRPRLVQPDAVVAAEVKLAPADLAQPATLDVPLRVYAEPGSTVEVEHFEGGNWVPAGHGTVDTLGFTVHFDLARLPEAVRVKIPRPKPMGGSLALSAAPAINSVQRTPIEEGDTVALLVTGENFVPGLTQISVVRNGTVDSRIECRGTAVKADGTALGVTVEVGPLSELGEGAVSDHVLRVDTPAGRAEHALPILCHDELIVGAGQTVTVSASRRLSLLRVDAGGTLLVTSTVPPVTIDVLGEAFIDGAVTVVAGTGASGGKGISGGGGGGGGAGAAPFAAAAGGTGGAGGIGDAVGLSGSAGSSPPGLVAGTAGAGGASGGGGLHPHLGGNGAKGGTAPFGRIPGFQAHSNLVVILGLGAGGGGGGGGGGEGWVFKSTGGGGGGGGAGGGGVGIAAGQGIRLRGIVMANGGDAGSGGTAGAGPPGVFDYISAGQGGGGGGGGGGTIFLQGITDSWNAYALAVSGKPGSTPSPTVQVEARTALQQALARESTGDIRADGAIVGLARPVATQGPDVLYIENLVATQPTVDVTGYNATHMRVASGFGSTRRAVTWSGSAGLNAETVLCRAPVPLAEGFNDIIAEWMWETYGLPESSPLLDAQVLMVSAAVRTRKVLRISGTIPFYDFAATIAPAVPTVATERAVDLTANVTATQPTPLLWSVVGGDEFGTVLPQPNGARYRAPTRPLAFPATVVVASALSPARTASVPVTVLPGIVTSAVAATGRPAIASLPSANAGQVITIDIPAATYAVTNEGFANVPVVEFPVLRPKVGGGCERAIVPIAPAVATGLQSLTADVPACADPGGWVRVPGHGSARLQIVPEVTQIDGNRAADPDYYIRGTGFACGETQVLINGIAEPATSMLSLTCGTIHMAQWPPRGSTLIVRTSGGDSAPFTVP